jgi:hypothetical protein
MTGHLRFQSDSIAELRRRFMRSPGRRSPCQRRPHHRTFERNDNHYFDSEQIVIAIGNVLIAHWRCSSIYAIRQQGRVNRACSLAGLILN